MGFDASMFGGLVPLTLENPEFVSPLYGLWEASRGGSKAAPEQPKFNFPIGGQGGPAGQGAQPGMGQQMQYSPAQIPGMSAANQAFLNNPYAVQPMQTPWTNMLYPGAR